MKSKSIMPILVDGSKNDVSAVAYRKVVLQSVNPTVYCAKGPLHTLLAGEIRPTLKDN